MTTLYIVKTHHAIKLSYLAHDFCSSSSLKKKKKSVVYQTGNA